MRAIVYERYGGPEVLILREIEKPAPRAHDILIRVRATTVTAGDCRARSLRVPRGFGLVARFIFGFTRPRQPILGSELAGDIEAVGAAVTRWKVSDAVFAFPGAGLGGYADYKCMAEDGLVARKPPSLDYEESAALSFGGTTALHFLRQARIQSGQRVLVNGAAGGVGTAAVQLARHFGAEVTAVCGPNNLDLVRSLGASRAIDYTREDFAHSGETWDVIFDTAGTAPYSRCRAALTPTGRLVLVQATAGQMLGMPWIMATTRHRVLGGVPRVAADDLRFLAALVDAGAYKPPIDRRYPIAQIVEAHRHVDEGHKRGNVTISV